MHVADGQARAGKRSQIASSIGANPRLARFRGNYPPVLGNPNNYNMTLEVL